MNPGDKSLRKLFEAARRAPAGDESAPFGFSTRVAARAFDRAPSLTSFGPIALRALAVAGIVAALAVAANLSAIKGALDDESQFNSTDDPVSEVVDVGS
ncbi:MAG TPA: hypothetical protein VGG34_06980 [Opitutaceae bacterium]|jgi:hypothetical protein